MRKRFTLLGLIVVLAVAVLASLPLFVTSQSIETKLTERTRLLTGLELTFSGKAELKFFPYLGIELSNLRLNRDGEDAGQPIATIDQLSMRLEILALLSGNIRFQDFVMKRPVLFAEKIGAYASDPVQRFGLIARSVTAQRNANIENSDDNANPPPDAFAIGRFDIEGGELRFETKPELTASDINTRIAWRSSDAPFAASGNGVWKGEAIDFRYNADNLLALLAGHNSQTALNVKSSLVTADFNGDSRVISGFVANGSFELSTPNASALVNKIDAAIDLPIDILQLAMSGNAVTSGNHILFQDAKISVGENNATGTLQLDGIGSIDKKISGTLAFDNLDFGQFSNQEKPKNRTSENPSPKPIDVDLRFSSATGQLGDFKLMEMAATLITRGRDWDLEIGDAAVFGGRVMGKLSTSHTQGNSERSITGTFSSLEVSQFIRNWHEEGIILSGSSDLSFDLRSRSPDAGFDAIKEYHGSINVRTPEGIISGIDVSKVVALRSESDGFLTRDQIAGETAIKNLELDLAISNGLAWINSGKADLQQGNMVLFGKVDIASGGMALNAGIGGLNNEDGNPLSVRLFVGGTLRYPLVTEVLAWQSQNNSEDKIETDTQ